MERSPDWKEFFDFETKKISENFPGPENFFEKKFFFGKITHVFGDMPPVKKMARSPDLKEFFDFDTKKNSEIFRVTSDDRYYLGSIQTPG